MFFKKNLLLTAILTAAAALAVVSGCGDKPVDSTADTYGLKAVSLNSQELFDGDVSVIPGLPSRPAENTVLPKAATDALIDFDKAYAVVSQSFHGDYTMCEYWTDRYNAFKDADSSDLNKWETVLAGCRRSEFYDIVSVSELEIDKSYVSGTVYVKPGGNTVVVYFVNGKGEIIWYNRNTYINLDGLENSDDESYQYYIDHYESGWEYAWNNEDAYEFMMSYSSAVDGNYYYQVPSLGYWQNEIGIPAYFVEEQCLPPAVTLQYPANGATGVSTASLSVEWTYINLSYPSFTLYFGTENPPPFHADNIYYYMDYYYPTVETGQTYYWRVVGDDGTNQVTSTVFSFTTQ